MYWLIGNGFGCSYIGAVSETAVFELVEKCIEAGAQEL